MTLSGGHKLPIAAPRCAKARSGRPRFGGFISPRKAQNYLERPIRLIAPFPASRLVDVLARALGEELRKTQQQQQVQGGGIRPGLSILAAAGSSPLFRHTCAAAGAVTKSMSSLVGSRCVVVGLTAAENPV